MLERRTMVFTGATALLALTATACAPDSGTGTGGAGGGATAAVYRGTYEVPVTADLAAAAVYDVPEVEWTVVNGSVTLDYDLPLGLVGTKLRVEFTGPIDVTAGTATLVGPPGDADCTLSASAVSCLEKMSGLLPITPDLAVVESLAATEFAGPASMRVDVAKQFSVDPIGIVHVDLNAPVTPDSPETEKPEG